MTRAILTHGLAFFVGMGALLTLALCLAAKRGDDTLERIREAEGGEDEVEIEGVIEITVRHVTPEVDDTIAEMVRRARTSRMGNFSDN